MDNHVTQVSLEHLSCHLRRAPVVGCVLADDVADAVGDARKRIEMEFILSLRSYTPLVKTANKTEKKKKKKKKKEKRKKRKKQEKREAKENKALHHTQAGKSLYHYKYARPPHTKN